MNSTGLDYSPRNTTISTVPNLVYAGDLTTYVNLKKQNGEKPYLISPLGGLNDWQVGTAGYLRFLPATHTLVDITLDDDVLPSLWESKEFFDDPARVLYLQAVEVRRDRRGEGICRRMFDEFEAMASSQNMFAYGVVLEQNERMLTIFQRRGYSLIGRSEMPNGSFEIMARSFSR